MPGHETTFLIDTVGDAVAQGVAATVAAQPSDPVEYLAGWLLRYVESEQAQTSYFKEKKQQIDQEKRRVAQALEEENAKKAASEARKAAVDGLAAMAADPVTAWQKAVQLVKMYTSAASVYVANIVDEEQPGWTPPDDSEADVETDDEAEHAAAAAAAADDPAADSEETPPADGDHDRAHESAEDAPTAGSAAAIPDYSSKLLRYVAASTGQEFMAKLELRRPKAAEDESAEGQPPELTPITFKILDEHMPLLEVPAVATEPRVKFLRKFPRIGGYCAAAVPAGSAGPAAGCYQAVLAADTLLPEGHGQALSQDEVSFIWDVAQALGSALDTAAASRKTDAARGGAADVLARLAASIADIRKSAQQPAAAAEVAEDPAVAEGDDESTGQELSPADQIALMEVQLQHTQQKLATAKVTAANAAAALELEKRVLEAIVKAIMGVRGVAIAALKLFSCSPPATLHVLRAVLLLLGRDPASLATWREAVQHVHVGTFEDIAAYDATQDRNMELWKKVRAAYKAIQKPQDLEKDLPQCGLGVILLQWIKQVRLVSRKAAAVRGADQSVAVNEEAIARKQQQLSEAKEAKARADQAEAEAVAVAASEEAGTPGVGGDEVAEEEAEDEQ